MRPTPEPVEQAARLVATRYPDALAAVLGGSTARGRTTPTSDLDIAVLLPEGSVTRRETVRHGARTAEVFLHTPTTVEEFFASDTRSRRGTMLFIYAESLPVHDPDGRAAALVARARELLSAGPAPPAPQDLEGARYGLTDLLEDLVDTTDRHEQLAVADRVLRDAADLLTAHRNAWTGGGKWLPRRLLAADPILGRALLDGHLAVAEHADPVPLATAAQTVLTLVGGPLRDGYASTWTGTR
ncbi:nucleotidyltransferase domain-containing protein [Streptomyces phyllanthi]|nr:nucleotidyltransferase domain-containing protein [Streptomyces phyllanthi]